MAILSINQAGYVHATDVNVRQSPVNGTVLYRAQRNELIVCRGTASGSDGYTWLLISNTSYPNRSNGYIRHDFVTAGTPGSGTGTTATLKTGIVRGPGYLNVKNAVAGSNTRKLPEGRMVVYESPATNGYVRIRWRGDSQAWIQESWLNSTATAAPTARARLSYIAEQEQRAVFGTRDEEEFYGAPIGTNYCHYFADAMAASAFYNTSALPMKGNCKDGVIHFLQKGGFYFVNAAHKKDVWDNATNMKQYMDGATLNSRENQFSPQPGHYVYFHTIPKETASHVGIVTRVLGNYIETVEGNVGTKKTVGFRTYNATSTGYHADIMGFGVPVEP